MLLLIEKMDFQIQMIKTIFFTLFIFCGFYAYGCEETYDKRWVACVKDTDCVAIEGACRPISVSKNFKTEAEKYYACLSKTVDCQPPKTEKTLASCINKTCTLVDIPNKKN